MSRRYMPEDEVCLQKLHKEHTELAQYQPGLFILRDLFSDSTFDIVDYCKGFRPNPHAKESEAEIKAFANHHNIWLDGSGDHYNSMTAYLHPTPCTQQRLTIMGKVHGVLFFMNDTIGREKLGKMSAGQKADIRRTVERLTQLLLTDTLPPNSGDIEKAAESVLHDMRALADGVWYRDFVRFTLEHFEPSFFDRNARAQGTVMSVQEYIDCRLDVSGMFLAIAMMEFGDDAYINWEQAASVSLADDLKRHQWLCAAIGALMNDLFSFEKEFIVEGSDFNLLPIIALNNPECSLKELVMMASALVLGYVKEFHNLTYILQEQCTKVMPQYPQLAEAMHKHIQSLVASVHATWVWQNDTERYKQKYTIFAENALAR